jgi:hypothetical protein
MLSRILYSGKTWANHGVFFFFYVKSYFKRRSHSAFG